MKGNEAEPATAGVAVSAGRHAAQVPGVNLFQGLACTRLQPPIASQSLSPAARPVSGGPEAKLHRFQLIPDQRRAQANHRPEAATATDSGARSRAAG